MQLWDAEDGGEDGIPFLVHNNFWVIMFIHMHQQGRCEGVAHLYLIPFPRLRELLLWVHYPFHLGPLLVSFSSQDPVLVWLDYCARSMFNYASGTLKMVVKLEIWLGKDSRHYA